jgi:hypothetical protein
MRKQYAYKFQKNMPENADSNSSKVGNTSGAIQEHFHTSNNMHHKKPSHQSVTITQEEYQIVKDFSEIDSDDMSKEQPARLSVEPTTKILKSQPKILNFNESMRQDVKGKRRIYINEFGEESFLSESSVEEPRKVQNRVYES